MTTRSIEAERAEQAVARIDDAKIALRDAAQYVPAGAYAPLAEIIDDTLERLDQTVDLLRAIADGDA